MKPACWEACFLYPSPTVEHSNNCLLLLCRLFLEPSGHYTNKAPLNEFIWLRDAFNGRYNTAFISDANAATTSGFYRYYANSANTPWAGGGTLFTLAFDGGSGIVQITFFNGSPAAASLRARYNNTWTGWKAL